MPIRKDLRHNTYKECKGQFESSKIHDLWLAFLHAPLSKRSSQSQFRQSYPICQCLRPKMWARKTKTQKEAAVTPARGNTRVHKLEIIRTIRESTSDNDEHDGIGHRNVLAKMVASSGVIQSAYAAQTEEIKEQHTMGPGTVGSSWLNRVMGNWNAQI